MDEDETEECTNSSIVSEKKYSASSIASLQCSTKVATSVTSSQRLQTMSSISSAQQSSVRSTFKSQSSKQFLSQSAQSSIAEEEIDDSRTSKLIPAIENTSIIPPCTIITHQASGDSDSGSDENARTTAAVTIASATAASQRKVTKQRFQILSKSAQNSSSSQEEYEPDTKYLSATAAPSLKSSQASSPSNQYLSAAARVETARSMESLRTTGTHHRSSFITSSERDVRRIISSSVEAKSLENLEREARLKRRAISGEDIGLGLSAQQEETTITAEKKRGLFASSGFASERRTHKVPQHLSLPPPGGYQATLSPGDRRLTILSPHSPHHTPDLLQFSQTTYTTLKTRRKKAIVLPRLLLPRSDSDASSSDVFLDHDLS